MKHKCLTALFALCLAVSINAASVSASEVSQGKEIATAKEAEISGRDEAESSGREEAAAAEVNISGTAETEAAAEENHSASAEETESTESKETSVQPETPPSAEQPETPPAEEQPEAVPSAEQPETPPAEEQPETPPAEEQPAPEAAAEQIDPAAAEQQTVEEADPATAEQQTMEGADPAAAEQQLQAEAGLTTAEEQPATEAAEEQSVPATTDQQVPAELDPATAAAQLPTEVAPAAKAEAVSETKALEKQSLTAAVSQKIKQMKLEVIDFKNQGYGDSQMLTSSGKKLLIDTYVKESWGALNDWLSDHGYRDFDIYVSHYHDDHMGNIRNILNDGKYKVTNLYLPDFSYMNGTSEYMVDYIAWCKRIINNAKEKNVKITYLKKGSSFKVGDVDVNVLWGANFKSGWHGRSYINNNSLVTRFTCGNTRYLNAGDIELEAEKQILKEKVDVKADIFKMSHHGSDTSNSDAFLKAVNASFYYYNSLNDSPSKYSASGTMSYDTARRAKKYGNVASVRYNGDITYTVYDNIISQDLKRNYTEQKVYLYDKSDSKKLEGVVTHKLNKATTRKVDDRAYDGYSSASAKRAGTYVEDGWVRGNAGNEYYYKNNEPLTGWKKIDGDLYHFNTKTAKRDTGWKKFGKFTFYFDGAGRVAKGNRKIGNSVYHFDAQGRLVKAGWVETNGRRSYVSPATGTVLTGFKKVNGAIYYFDANGYLLRDSGFVKLGGKTYYKKNDGSMKTGWLSVNGKLYYMNADGSMRTKWLKKGEKLFYFQPDGALIEKRGFVRIGKKIFFVCKDGFMKTGWLRVNGKLYYMGTDGARRTGWQKIGRRSFYFEKDGALRNG